MMHITVAYAPPDEQIIIDLDVEPGITVNMAIERSGILERYPEIDLAENKVGVFGKLGRLEDVLNEGDRVEIYRKLIADPKQARRQRAEKEQVK
jgi:hypothetical protein